MRKLSKHPKKLWVVYIIVIIAFIGLQFLQSSIPNPAVTGDFNAPSEVKNILKRACYDCHSNETDLKWFDKIAPASWLVMSDVKKAREALNFSNWDSLTEKQQIGTLFTAVNFIMLKEMPLKQYTLLHPDAKVTHSELQILEDYIAALTPVKSSDSAAFIKSLVNYEDLRRSNSRTSSRKVLPAPNGINYIQGYQNWQAISTTDRFDNGTMRIIYGNGIAVDAINKNNISPWPDGAIFAKVLWKQLIDKEGNVTPGDYIHSEFMIKDAKKYKNTDGWGWARWVGSELKPYGKSAAFVAECMDCHQPMKDNDFVFTMPLQHKNKL